MSKRWKPSVTVAAIVAAEIDGQTRYLLVEEITPEGLMLNNPAGHLDPGESPQQGVVREALEETTRDFSPQNLVGIYMSRFTRLPPTGTAEAQQHAPSSTADPASGYQAGNEGADDAAQAVQDVTYLRFAYGGTVGEADPRRSLDEGIVRTLWMSLDEVRASQQRHRSGLVLRCIEDHAAGRCFPLALVSIDASLYSPEIKSPA